MHRIRNLQVCSRNLTLPMCRADEITEASVAAEAATGKAYLHSSTDVHGRPVIVIRVNKHITSARRAARARTSHPYCCPGAMSAEISRQCRLLTVRLRCALQVYDLPVTLYSAAAY